MLRHPINSRKSALALVFLWAIRFL